MVSAQYSASPTSEINVSSPYNFDRKVLPHLKKSAANYLKKFLESLRLQSELSSDDKCYLTSGIIKLLYCGNVDLSTKELLGESLRCMYEIDPSNLMSSDVILLACQIRKESVSVLSNSYDELGSYIIIKTILEAGTEQEVMEWFEIMKEFVVDSGMKLVQNIWNALSDYNKSGDQSLLEGIYGKYTNVILLKIAFNA